MRRLPWTPLLIFAALLVIAGFVWVVDLAADPQLIPAMLAATPTASAQAAETSKIATQEAHRSRTSKVNVKLTGLSETPLVIHRCAGEQYSTGRRLPAGKPFDIWGWDLDVNAETWILIKDDPGEPQQWVRLSSDAIVSLNEDFLVDVEFRFYYPEATQCRP